MPSFRSREYQADRAGAFLHQRLPGIISLSMIAMAAGALSGPVLAREPVASKAVFDIRPQELTTGLVAFAEQADMQLVASSGDLGDARTDGVRGSYAPEEALRRLLADSGLGYTITGASVVILAQAQSQAPVSASHRASALSQESSSAAPAESGRVLEVVTVTARLRAESMIDVPASVTALSASDLERYDVSTIANLAEMTPNINLGYTAGGSGASLSIRGIGSDGSNAGIEQSVMLNVDGVQVTRGRALWQSYFDLEQIEVLKGPQALFFGKNSPAGVIALTSRGATPSFSAYAQVGYEFEADEVLAEGAIAGPFTDAIGARLAVRARNMDGFMRNIAQPMANPSPSQPSMLPGARNPRLGEREVMGRLTLELDAGGPFTAALKILGSDYEDDNTLSRVELINCSSGDTVLLRSILGRTLVDPVGECRANWQMASSDIPREVAAGMIAGGNGDMYTDQKAIIASLTMNYNFGNFILTSITGYHDNDTRYLMNNDWTSFASIASTEHEDYDAFSQELRLLSDFDGPVNFMVGGYFQSSDLLFRASRKFDDIPADPVTGRYQWFDALGSTDGETLSFFGQVIWDVTDTIELAGGARWTHETKDSIVGVTYSNPVVAASFPVRMLESDFDDQNVSPEFTVTWRPRSDRMFYAAYKTGYKSGGAGVSSVVNAGTTLAQIEFDPEEAEGFEVGAKLELLAGTLRINATAYTYDYEDLQLNSFDTATSSFFTRNAAEAKLEGVEGEMLWLASDRLSLRGALAYNKSEYESFPNAQCYSGQTLAQGCTPTGQDLTGRRTTNAPEWSGLLGFTYTWPILNGLKLEFSGDGTFMDEYVTSQTQNPAGVQDSSARWNARISLSHEDESWGVALISRNLTDEKIIVSAQDRPGGIGDLRGTLYRPREVLLQVSTRF